MKKIIIFALSFGTINVNAQSLKLKIGEKITITTKSTMVSMKQAELGGGESKIQSTMSGVINFTGQNNDSYLGSFTGIRMTSLNGEGVAFDSDKKQDLESDYGKIIASNLNKSVAITINKENGITSETENKKTESFSREENDNEVKTTTQSTPIKMNESVYANAFFIVPSDKKIGDKWTLDKSEGEMKYIKNFSLKSITENIATIDFSSTRKGTFSNENNGIQTETFIDSKGKGTIIVDTKTGLVKKISSLNELNGEMESMGRSISISNKTTTETIFN